MNWQTVWEVIQKYWVQQLCVLTYESERDYEPACWHFV